MPKSNIIVEKKAISIVRSRIRITKAVNLARDLWSNDDISVTEELLAVANGTASVSGHPLGVLYPAREIVLDVLEIFDSMEMRDIWFAESGRDLEPVKASYKDGELVEFDETGERCRPLGLFLRFVANAREWATGRPHSRIGRYHAGQVLVNESHEELLIARGFAERQPYIREEIETADMVHAAKGGCQTYPEFLLVRERLKVLQESLLTLDFEVSSARRDLNSIARSNAERLMNPRVDINQVKIVETTGSVTSGQLNRRNALVDAISLGTEQMRILTQRLSDEVVVAMRSDRERLVGDAAAGLRAVTVAQQGEEAIRREMSLEGLDSQRFTDLGLGQIPVESWLTQRRAAGYSV